MKSIILGMFILLFSQIASAEICTYAMTDIYGNYPYEEFEASGMFSCEKAYKKCDRALKSRKLDGVAKCTIIGRGIFHSGTFRGYRYEIPHEGGIRIYFGK